jgi:hypothetical protein|eukprot:COSAG01_NODE_7356_length_3238_cov_1.440586_4_plen_48_part_00
MGARVGGGARAGKVRAPADFRAAKSARLGSELQAAITALQDELVPEA